MWFTISDAQGRAITAEHPDEIAQRMTPSRIAEAKKLARE
jgi:hypothetical protein